MIRDYIYIFLGLISISLALSLILPRAPYSERKGDAKKGAARKSGCCYGLRLFSPIFSLKMLVYLPHILPSASI
jgi:hypothetical protein